jgi:hypothetical protein
MTFVPATYDVFVEQNATFKMSLTLTNASGSYLDVTGWTFAGAVKEQANTTLPPSAIFSIAVVSAVSGTIQVTLPASQSAQLTKPRYSYDIQATNTTTNPPEVYRLIQGKVTVNLAVTSL